METNTLKLTFHPHRPCQTATEHNGRVALTYHVFGRIGTEDVQSFALIGTEKMGKTSFLNYLRQPEVLANHLQEHHKYLFVYLDAKHDQLADEPVFFRTLFSQEPFTPLTGLTSIKDLRSLSNWLESQDKRLVVMIDNFNLIVSNPNFRVPFYEGLRSWFSTQRRVGCVVTSTLPLLQIAMAIELSGSPFFNIFTTYLLEPLSWEEAKALLSSRLPLHLRERDIEIDRLLEEFGTFPYPLQQAGKCWIDMAEHRHIPPLKKVIEAAYQACLGYYENIYSSLKRHQLAVIDSLLDPRQPKPDPDRIDRTLIERGWVSEDGRHITARQMARFFRTKLGLPESLGVWQKLTTRFQIDLLRRWIAYRFRFGEDVEVYRESQQEEESTIHTTIEGGTGDKQQVQAYLEQLQQLLREEDTMTLTERQLLDKSVTDFEISPQRAVQLENQVRAQLRLSELDWRAEYRESCQVLQRQYSRHQVPAAKLLELKATYEDRQRVGLSEAKEIRQYLGVAKKGQTVALWVGSIVGVLLLLVIVAGVLLGWFKSENPQPSTTGDEKTPTTETKPVEESKPSSPSPATTEVQPVKPETPIDSGQGKKEEKPVEPKVTSIQGYDFLVVDLDKANKKKLFLVNSSEAKPVPLLEGLEEEQSHPSISRDNQFLVFQQGKDEICLIQLAQQKRILPCQPGKTPAFAPDGSQVVYVSVNNEALGIWQTGTQSPTTVRFEDVTGVSSPVFLSDSQHIVFIAQKAFSEILLYDSKEIMIAKTKLLTGDVAINFNLVASPTQNLVLNKNKKGEWSIVPNLDSTTGNILKLSISPNAISLHFSRDGKRLYYIDKETHRIAYSKVSDSRGIKLSSPQDVNIFLTEPKEVVPLR